MAENELKQIDHYRWEIAKSGQMRVPGIILCRFGNDQPDQAGRNC